MTALAVMPSHSSTDWNGAPVILESNHDFPYVQVHLTFHGGSLTDPPGKEGLAYIAAQMALRGTGALSESDFAEAVDRLGGSFEVSIGKQHVVADAEVLSRNLAPLLELVGQALTSPTNAQSELDKLVRQTVTEVEELRDSDEDLGRHIFDQARMQPDPSARPVKGTPDSLRAITLQDVQAAFKRQFVKKRLVVGAAGDVTPQAMKRHLDHAFSAMPEGAVSPPHTFDIRDPGTIRVILVDKPERTQAQVFLGHRGIAAGHPDYDALSVANTVYGGTFTARLSAEIREKRGWSYGAYSVMSGRKTEGSFTFRFYPATKDLLPALTLGLKMQRELIEQGVTDQEVEHATSYLVNNHPFRLDTPRKRLDDALRLELLDLPRDSTRTYVKRLSAVTVDQANAAVKKHLKWADLTVVIVCTATKALQEAVAALPGVGQVVVHPYALDWPHPSSHPSQ